MLIGFTWGIPLKTKTAAEVVTAYKNHIACPFRGSLKILRDNRTEFKNKLFKEVVTKLGTEMSYPFTTIQTTEQWEDRRITQIPQGLHCKAHQPQIGMG